MTGISRPRPTDPQQGLTISGLTEPYLLSRQRRGEIVALTARNERAHLHGFADVTGDLPVVEITRVEAARYLESLHGLAPATRRRQWGTVRSFFRWLVTEGYVAADPVGGLPSPKEPRSVPRALSAEEVARLLGSLPDARAKVIVTLMLYLGLRCVEVARLRYDDISGESVRIVGKGSHVRILPLLPEVSAAIATYAAGCANDRTGLVVRAHHRAAREGQGLAADTISGLVAQWMKDAGVQTAPRDGRSAHSLRHSCASDMMKGGAHLRDIQRALGHSSLVTTERYLALKVDGLAHAMGGRTYGETDIPIVEPIVSEAPGGIAPGPVSLDAIGPLIDAVAALTATVRQMEERLQRHGPATGDVERLLPLLEAAGVRLQPPDPVVTCAQCAMTGKKTWMDQFHRADEHCPECGWYSGKPAAYLARHRRDMHQVSFAAGCTWAEAHDHTGAGHCVCPLCRLTSASICWGGRTMAGHLARPHAKCPDCDRSFMSLGAHRRRAHAWSSGG